METEPVSRRAVVAMAGSLAVTGCTSLRERDSSERLPILIALEVHNDSDRTREYQIRVRYTTDRSGRPETVFSSRGVVRARSVAEFERGWPKEPGRYVIAVSVDGRDWHTHDLTDRLAQDERICYDLYITIGDDGEAETAWTNLDAPCPDR